MFSTDPGTGLFGLGFTGLMNNGTTDYLDQFVKDNLLAGGATGTFTIIDTTTGDAVRSRNDQDNGFQFGVQIDQTADTTTTVTSRIQNPFKNQTPENWQSSGIHIGTGDQDSYIKIVLAAGGGNGTIQVLYEEAGQQVAATNYGAPGVLTSDNVDLFLEVDPNAGTVTPSWQYTASDGTPYSGVGNTITVTGDVLAAIQGTYTNQGLASGLAVGTISTHFNASQPITASYDHIAVYAEQDTTATTSTFGTTSTLTASTSDSLQTTSTEPVTLSTSTMDLMTTDSIDTTLQTASTTDTGTTDTGTTDTGSPDSAALNGETYAGIQFEEIGDRTVNGILDNPGALVVKSEGPVNFDTRDTLFFHGMEYQPIRDLPQQILSTIQSGGSKGFLEDIFGDRVPGLEVDVDRLPSGPIDGPIGGPGQPRFEPLPGLGRANDLLVVREAPGADNIGSARAREDLPLELDTDDSLIATDMMSSFTANSDLPTIG
jgi:hypothetical protein